MAPRIADQVAVEQLQPGEFISKALPIRMGNSLPIAYGGCTASVAVSAACATAPPTMSLYSVLGHFLGPASTDRKLHCSVTNTRDTRSFATRRVQVKQEQPDGRFRICLELLADFHIKEPSTLTYSERPSPEWPGPEECPPLKDLVKTLVKKKVVTGRQAEGFLNTIGVEDDFFEMRYCPGGVSTQNLYGSGKATVTTQDDRPLVDKTSAEWMRARGQLTSPAQNLGTLSFLMDAALSFLALSHNHMWLEDSTACSTLDFALRIFVPEVNLSGWHMKERRTTRGGHGRTFAESKLWDEQGNLVASMSQQSILRLKKEIPQSKLS
ncbi:hypothetical protein ACJ41O_010375 [Fusarium nematophilum]